MANRRQILFKRGGRIRSPANKSAKPAAAQSALVIDTLSGAARHGLHSLP
jgi:hypothetical protein